MSRNDWRWRAREIATGLAFALCCALAFVFLLLIEPAHGQTIDVSFQAEGKPGCWEVERLRARVAELELKEAGE